MPFSLDSYRYGGTDGSRRYDAAEIFGTVNAKTAKRHDDIARLNARPVGGAPGSHGHHEYAMRITHVNGHGA